MNDASANLPPLAPPAASLPPGESWPAGPGQSEGWPAEPKLDEGWSGRKILFLIALAVAVHLALIFAFGTKKQFVPRPVTGVPRLQFAGRADELLELDNPTLFAMPNPRDFSSAVWQKHPALMPNSLSWQAMPGELAEPAPENLGSAFAWFIQTNQFKNLRLGFKPPPQFAELGLSFGLDLPQQSTLRISGALAQRPLLAQPALPSLELPDIIAPSKVQVTVDQSGNVISAVLLPSDNLIEAGGRSPTGDTNAVALARGLKFAPAAQLAFGEITFYWHTVPPPATNAPAGLQISP